MMRRIILVAMALAIQTSISMAREVDICVAESEVKDGVRITTSGVVMEIKKCAGSPKKCLELESYEDDDDYCLVTVYPKTKIPSNCRVGNSATVTGVVKGFMGFNDLLEAKISCEKN